MASRRTLLAFFALAATSCLSPTLPLPPPSQPDVEGPDPQGIVTLDGYVAENNSAVIAVNYRTGDIRGRVVDGNAHYRFEIPAEIGDTLELWYTIGEEKSPSLVFEIVAPTTP